MNGPSFVIRQHLQMVSIVKYAEYLLFDSGWRARSLAVPFNLRSLRKQAFRSHVGAQSRSIPLSDKIPVRERGSCFRGEKY